ncbi:MAG: response regulator transcription factor [Lachnospiraceae bacterium]|nr:response regulator transcription factor [Lachnospiraceae bacterium]
MQARILLAEDNDHLREVLSDSLEDQGYIVEAAENGSVAWALFQENTFDLVLLDVMMPEMDGFELCKKIREQEDTPILFITARVQEEDQIYGYRLGADDYIVKPFSLPVLHAKCQVVLERSGRGNTVKHKWLEAGELRINLNTRQVYLADKEVSMQQLDYRLLCYMVQNQDRVFTREQLLLKIWGFDYEGNDRSVDTHIKKLRRALGKHRYYIKTVVKQGYKFSTEE